AAAGPPRARAARGAGARDPRPRAVGVYAGRWGGVGGGGAGVWAAGGFGRGAGGARSVSRSSVVAAPFAARRPLKKAHLRRCLLAPPCGVGGPRLSRSLVGA